MARIFLMVVALTTLSGVLGDVLVIDTMQENSTLTSFQDMQAGFGDDFPEGGLEGYLVYADPKTACGPLKNPAPFGSDHKWILLIARGGGDNCQFSDKVLNAQMNNYDAAIVHDDRQESRLPMMRGGANGTKVMIPSTFIGLTSGQILAKDFTYKAADGRYIIQIDDTPEFDYRMYLWPFAIVVAVCFLLVMVFLLIKLIREHARRRLNRLSSRHLKKIPVRKYKKGDYYDTCAICLDEYEEGEKIRVLPCEHVYHTKCIDPWLTKNKKTCPVCKRRVIPGRDADSDDSDSDGGESSQSERRPLLQEGTRRLPNPYGVAGGHRAAAADVHEETEGAQATGGVGISEGDRPGPAGAEEDVPDTSSDRRRKRRERRQREGAARQGARTTGEDDERAPEGAAAFPEMVREALERDETREERRERKKKMRDAKKKKRRAAAQSEAAVSAPAQASGDGDEVHDLLDSAEHQRRALLEDEEDEFLSARSSFRSIECGDADDDVQIDKEEEERKMQLEKEREGYINPSYSESQEVVVPSAGRRELNEVV